MRNKENAMQRANDRKRVIAKAGISAWNKRPVIFRDKHKEKRDQERFREAFE